MISLMSAVFGSKRFEQVEMLGCFLRKSELIRLLGSPQADFHLRNQRLKEILAAAGVVFAPPGDDGSQYALKGTASLCANLAFATLAEYPLFAVAAVLQERKVISGLRVLCRSQPNAGFPFEIANGFGTAFQTRLSMHRPARRRGDVYQCTTTGRASFLTFWESLLADMVLGECELMREEVEWELRNQGFQPNPVMVRAGLHIAIGSLLREREPSGPVAEVWYSCGLDENAISSIIRNWVDGFG